MMFRNMSPKEAGLAEKYIKEESGKAKFMTGKEMSEKTSVPARKCGQVLKRLRKSGFLQEQYAIYCPACGGIVDRQTHRHSIKRSGYTCPWCRQRVDYGSVNIRSLYVPWSAEKIAGLRELRFAGAVQKKRRENALSPAGTPGT